MCLTPAYQYLGYADSMHMHFRQVDTRGDGHMHERKHKLKLWTFERRH
jgi:hypothetical protein